MSTRVGCVCLLALLVLAALPAAAADKLTLQDAERIARQNPRLRAAQFSAMAAEQLPKVVRSNYFPYIQGNLTGADSQTGTRIAAGFLNNPTVLERYSNGLAVSQLITDFGRTHELVRSAQFRAYGSEAGTQMVEQDVILEVDRAFYDTLRAQSVLRVATDAVAARQLTVDQVTALANAKLKSELDVSFAQVNLTRAKLMQTQAQNDLHAAMARLSTAMGYSTPQDFQPVDDTAPLQPPPDSSLLIGEAMQQRPDIRQQQMNASAAHSFANAERDLFFPSLSAVAVGGLTPYRDPLLHSHYGAAGFNLNLPLFTGFQFSARRKQARLREEVEKEQLRETKNQAVRDVHVAWLNADTAYQRLPLTDQLLAATKQALDLAQARYKLGLSSIIEVSQAQLDETEAEIAQAGAIYDYKTQLAQLNRELGQLH